MQTAIVTGGAGFIGSHIVDTLLRGGWRVEVMDDLSSGRREHLPASVPLHHCDVRSAEAAAILIRVRPALVVHAAAQISVRASMEDPAFDVAVNVGGIVNLLTATNQIVAAGGIAPHVVFISTGGAIYGEQSQFPAPEGHPIAPASIYGLSKRVSEEYLEFWGREHGLRYTVLRLANIYGPRQNPHGEAGVVAIFCQRLWAKVAPTVNGSGDQTRDFVYVEDVARAVELVVQRRVQGTFNIGTGQETSVNELLRLLTAAIAPGVAAVHVPAKAGEQQRSVISSALAAATFGWKPQVTVAEGLARTAAWFRGSAGGSPTA